MNFFFIEKMLWAVLAGYWLISAQFVKKSVKQESGWKRIVYIACMLLAFSLLFADYFPLPFLYRPFIVQNEYWKIAGLVLCATGLIFAVTARIYLGENWSGRITIKERHELIQTGPYRITRNPIYTGFLLAFCGCSMTLGLIKGYLGIALLIICLLIKISKEEEYMQEIFGEKFRLYQTKVKRLIPLLY